MSGVYSTVTFGPFGEVFVWHEVMPVVAPLPSSWPQPPPTPTAKEK